MGALIRRWLRYSVLRKGGNSPFWSVIGVLGVLNTLRKKFGGPKTTSLLSDGIRFGEVIEIRHTGKTAKPVHKERAKKAALLAQLVAADPKAKGRYGRKSRKLHKRLAGSVIAEMASRSAASNATSAPVTALLESAATALGASARPLSRRSRRKTAKTAAKVSKRAEKALRKGGR
jgi:hypothetical protein